MPRKNILKQYGAQQYYHVYNRGVGKVDIFRDQADYGVLLNLLKQRLSPEASKDKFGRDIPNYADKAELVAYCLMPNHYHLFVYLQEADGLEKLMRSVMTSYSRYFNRRHGREGALFQNHYLASRITNEAYFWHITRYIHLNPIDLTGVDYTTYPYSSIEYYLGERRSPWLHEEHVVESPEERVKYAEFIADYEQRHFDSKDLKDQLANL